jgi:hypothetical protein
VSVDGEKVSGSGRFDLEGHGTLTKKIPRKKSLQADLDVALDLDLVNQQLTGTVAPTNGPWYSDLLADQAVWNKLDVVATNFNGSYTLVVTGATTSAGSPGGDGYGTVSIDTNGVIKLAGNLGDNEVLAQKVTLSKDGQWPLYSRMDKDTLGIFRGVILGWVTVTNGDDRNLGIGPLDWVKTGMGSLYLGGFTNLNIELLTSEYSVPDVGERAINLNDSGPNGIGYVELEQGQMTNLVAVSNVVLTPMPTNKFLAMKYDASTNPVTLVLSKPVYKTGVVKGTFINPATAVKLNLTGVILQDANVARGYFMKKGVSTESGSFLLAPQ